MVVGDDGDDDADDDDNADDVVSNGEYCSYEWLMNAIDD